MGSLNGENGSLFAQARQLVNGRSLAELQSRDHWLKGKGRGGHSGLPRCLDIILDPRPVLAMPLPLRPD